MSEYPSDWEIANLGNLATIKASNVDKKAKEGQKEISLCNYMDVFKNPVVSSALAFMKSTASEKEISEFSLSKGDVLLTKDSEVPEEIGIPSVVAEEIPDLICGYHLYMVRANRSRINPEYLCWALRSNSSRQYFYQMANGSTRFGLNLKHVEECPIAVPPLPEQKKIAEVLSGIDRQIAGLIESRRLAGMAENEIVNRFIQQKATNCCNICDFNYAVLDGDRGAEYPKEKDFSSRGHCLFLSAKNVTSTGFSLDTCQYITKEKDEAMRKGRLDLGDLVITTRGTLGNIAHHDGSIPANSVRINSGMAVIRSKKERNRELERFIFFSLRSDFLQQQVAEASFGTAQNQLTLGIINKLRFPCFSSDDQTIFLRLCESAKSHSELISRSIEKHLQLKKAISADLLSGRKRVSI